MRINLFNRKQGPEDAGPPEVTSVNARYDEYFPRVFAYVHSCVAGDPTAQDIIVQAFSRAFSQAGASDEDRFRTELFRTARQLCRPALKDGKSDEGDALNARERDVISLAFDAGLSRDQIARLFRIRGKTVNSLLISGLRKLKEATSPAAAAASLNPA